VAFSRVVGSAAPYQAERVHDLVQHLELVDLNRQAVAAETVLRAVHAAAPGVVAAFKVQRCHVPLQIGRPGTPAAGEGTGPVVPDGIEPVRVVMSFALQQLLHPVANPVTIGGDLRVRHSAPSS
jgi:hypothetical protein